MNFNEFVNEVKDNIKLFLPRDYENAEVSTMECHKLNRAYTGLMVRKEGEMLTPTIQSLKETIDKASCSGSIP